MQNEQGEFVDLYIPRKCSATNNILDAKDYASIQINIADIGEDGVALKTSNTFALCGKIRKTGESDDCLNRLAKQRGILAKNF